MTNIRKLLPSTDLACDKSLVIISLDCGRRRDERGCYINDRRMIDLPKSDQDAYYFWGPMLKGLPELIQMITLPDGTSQENDVQDLFASDGRLNKQPNSDFCFVCGRLNKRGLYMTFHDDGKNEVISEYTVPEEYQGYPGIVHGGIVTAMLDEVVGRVAMIGDHHHFMLSVRLEVKFRQIVPTVTPLRIVGRIVRLRGRLGKAVGEVILPDGTIAAESELTLADVPQEWLADVDLDESGWRVDP